MRILTRAKIDGKLELKFRELAMQRFGYCKGSLSRVIEETILRWIVLARYDDLTAGSDFIGAIDSVLPILDIYFLSLFSVSSGSFHVTTFSL